MSVTKDKGLSWIILAASFFNQMIILGTLLCFGIYLVVIVETFKCTKRAAATVGAIGYGVQCLMGPVSGALYRKFGCRIIIQIGGLTAATGFALSYFADDVFHLYLTFFVVGVGFGLVYSPSVGILPDYFDKYRYFATSFATVGSAVGTLTFSPFLLHLINQYTWRGSMLINAGVALQIVVFGAFMRSRTLNTKINFRQIFELQLFANLKFLTMFFDGVCFGGAIFVVFGLANQLVINHGLDKQQSALMVSIMGFCNVFGRFSSSVIAQCSWTNRLLYFAVCGCFCGLSACLASICDNFWSFVVTLGLFGVFFGAKLSQLASANMELFGPQKLITTIGYSMFSFGVGGVSLPLLAGFIADRSRTENSYIMAGSCILSSFCLLCIFVVRFKKNDPPPPAVALEEEGALSPVLSLKLLTSENNSKSELESIEN